MRGPIDYIVVNFKGNKFNGDVLNELSKSVEKGIIAVLDIAMISKDKAGEVVSLELSEQGDSVLSEFVKNNNVTPGLITEEDVAEVGEIIEENSSVGLLVVEQLWAKDLKKAILNAGGELIAEGRIHPEAAEEIDKKGEK